MSTAAADWTGYPRPVPAVQRARPASGRASRACAIAAIGAPSMASMTQRVAQSAAMGVHRVLALSVLDPVPRLVERAPGVPAGRARGATRRSSPCSRTSNGAGRLGHRTVGREGTSSELRTAELTASGSRRAFGLRPFDFYGTTEGLWGVECEHHDGVHLFEDWCIAREHRRRRAARCLTGNRARAPGDQPLQPHPAADPLRGLGRRRCSTARPAPAGARCRGCAPCTAGSTRCCTSPGRPVHWSRSTRRTSPVVAGDPAVRQFQTLAATATACWCCSCSRARRRRPASGSAARSRSGSPASASRGPTCARSGSRRSSAPREASCGSWCPRSRERCSLA